MPRQHGRKINRATPSKVISNAPKSELGRKKLNLQEIIRLVMNDSVNIKVDGFKVINDLYDIVLAAMNDVYSDELKAIGEFDQGVIDGFNVFFMNVSEQVPSIANKCRLTAEYISQCMEIYVANARADGQDTCDPIAIENDEDSSIIDQNYQDSEIESAIDQSEIGEIVPRRKKLLIRTDSNTYTNFQINTDMAETMARIVAEEEHSVTNIMSKFYSPITACINDNIKNKNNPYGIDKNHIIIRCGMYGKKNNIYGWKYDEHGDPVHIATDTKTTNPDIIRTAILELQHHNMPTAFQPNGVIGKIYSKHFPQYLTKYIKN
jgi:hypothetical protein